MRVLIAAGGTGGHIYPGLTVAQALTDKGAKVLFVGTRRGLEADVVPRSGFDWRPIKARHIPRKISLEVPLALATAAHGTWEAGAIIREFRPDVVLGTGGYVAGPALMMAVIMRYPTVIHEQNAFPGITNRILAPFVDGVALGYPEAARYLRSRRRVVTGNPVRPEIVRCTKQRGIRVFGLDPTKKTLLVTAGSQGARSINKAMLEAAPYLNAREDLQVIHASGKALFPEVMQWLKAKGASYRSDGEEVVFGNMRIVPYVYAMPEALAAADLVVGRGGALTSAEFTVSGLPSILIPYPYSAEDHQVRNARVLEGHGAAQVLLDRDLSGQSLSDMILDLLDNPTRLMSMAQASKRLGKPAATEALVALINSVARRPRRTLRDT